MRGLIAMLACAGVISACEDAMGCSLNGDCVDRRCQCEPQWEGERCEVLRFVKPMDWESGYHVDGNASWGGNAIYEDGEYHLFMAQMLNGCGLDDYGSNSAIARASSKNVSGPYTFQEFVVLPFAHNPTIRKLPNGEGYIIYFIGGNTATPQICNNGTTPLRVAASTHHTTSHLPGDIRTSISTAVSPSLKGPWSISPLYFEGKSVNASTDLRTGFTNPSPHFHPDGSVTLAFQASPLGRHYELIGVARAASWNSTYALITGDPVIKNDPALCVAGMGEDPFIWEDRRGFHILIHGMCPSGFINAVYAYSNDSCTTWRKSIIPPYSYEVATSKGNHFFWRMERPQLTFQEYDTSTGFAVDPLALFTGVCNKENCLDNPGKRKLNWQTWTISRLLRTK
eukprot:TRINITY_DN3564_c0_g1_i1.p1 TRINITY_DN3564_c0_g1~~TRINITY_DN3564_c0_g1_i1.p1  ORF type:complete len:397 (+),score=19.88 TRINITY_DN3564_c0_g1_i1:44-1234(+)